MLVTLDYETYYDQKYNLRKVQTVPYINDPQFLIHGLGIKFGANSTEWLSESFEIEEALIEAFHPGNENTMLAQNTMFDGLITTQKFKLIPARYADTQSMSQGIFNGLPANLADICLRLWPNDPTKRKGKELEQTKGVRDLDDDLNELLGNYCINDVDLTYDAFHAMEDYLEPKEHDLIDLLIRFFTEPLLWLDKEIVREHMEDITAKKQAIIEASGLTATQLRARNGFPEYVASLGIPVPMKLNDKGVQIPAFAKDDIAFKKLRYDYPEYEHIWTAKLAVSSTIEETRCGRLLDATTEDGLLPVPLKYSGAGNTHRLSGLEKINLQNLGRESPLRRALVAPKGFKVMAPDASQIEARFVVALADQMDQMQEFTKSDPYAGLASDIYGYPVNKKDHPVERFVGKTAKLGLGFQMGASRFADTLRSGSQGMAVPITDDDAQTVVNIFRGKNPKVVSMWGVCQNEWLPAMANGDTIEYKCLTITKDRIILPSGMSLRYPNLQRRATNHEMTRFKWEYWNGKHWVDIFGGKLYENIIQGLARIKTMYDMLEINDWHVKNNAGRVVHTVHDEVITVTRDEAIEEADAMVAEVMSKSPDWMPEVILAMENEIGQAYAK